MRECRLAHDKSTAKHYINYVFEINGKRIVIQSSLGKREAKKIAIESIKRD